jgi:hypothetical protein
MSVAEHGAVVIHGLFRTLAPFLLTDLSKNRNKVFDCSMKRKSLMLERSYGNQLTAQKPSSPCRTEKIMDDPEYLQTIILGKKCEVDALTPFIPQELNPVCVLETTLEIDQLSDDISPRLIVTHDSFRGGINLRVLQKIKKKLNAAPMICLVNTISRRREIELRSAGLVFLGSPRIFLSHAREIVCNMLK